MDFRFTEFPKYKIVYGMLPVESENEIKFWLKDNLINLINEAKNVDTSDTNFDDFMRKVANNIFTEINQVGYEEGCESTEMDMEEC